jgi:dTMP kinase
MTGIFLTFEGGEGSGKTTQIQLLRDALVATGKQCLITREPGGSPGSEAIRNLLLTGAVDRWNPVAETLLFQAARIEHVERIIKPALARGNIVVSDRFLDSTIVYQGIAKGLGTEYIRQMYRLTLGNFMPDATIVLDVDPSIGLKRAASRQGDENRFEAMDKSFHQHVR